VRKRHLALGAFVVWEVYWAYVFISAPRPDEKMAPVFALLMGVAPPLVLVGPIGLIVEMRKPRKHKPGEQPE